jgi:VCBS repeat-containing protein
LTPGTDNFTGLADDFNQFQFTPSTLQSTDTVTGGAAGSFLDILVATAGGTISSAQFQGVTLVEQLNLSSGGNNVTLNNGLVAGTSVGYFAVVDGGGNDTVDASTISTKPIVFFAGAGSDTFKGGGGNDAVFIAPTDLTSADIFQGGPGADNLYLNAAGTVSASAFANVTQFEGLSLSSGGNTVTLTNGLVAGASYFSVNDGGGNDSVDASAVTSTPIVFFAGAGSDTFTAGSGNDAVFVATADLTSGDNFQGGAGIDNLYLTTAGTVAGSAFTNVSGFEGLVLSGLGNNVTLTNSLVAGSSNGVFAVADGAGNDTVDASGVTNGSSVVIFANTGNDTFRGGNGLNGYSFAVADLTGADIVTGGSAVDNLVFTTAGTLAASAFAQVTNVEAIILANGTNNVTLTNGLVAGTSIGYFAVAGGTGNDTADASGITNGTAIVFNGTTGGNDHFTGGNGNDSFQFAAGQLTAADSVTGGGGADTLWMTTAGTTNTADLAGVSGIEGVYLQNGGTFHLANGITAAAGLAATGSSAVDTFDGSAVTTYAISFTGNGGADTLTGGSQNDTFFIADSAFASINGNGGVDRITLTAASQSFNLTANAAKISNLEVIDLDSSLHSTLTLAGTDIAVVNASGTSLYVVGNIDDTVNAGNGYTQIASGVVNNAVAVGHTFYEYQHVSGSLLFIDTAITAVTATTGNGSANVPEGTAAGATVFDAHQSGATNYVLGGPDAALFGITAGGQLFFNASPDFETPHDQGTNNVYDVTVTSSNGTATPNFVETVAITVTDINDNAPVFTSGAAASTPENVATTTPVYTAHATDADASSTVSYSLASGGDNDRFNINSSTGDVTFKVSPNFEAPTDAGGNNVYDITVHASDGTFDTPKAVAITVTDVNAAPVFTSGTTGSEAENTPIANVVYDANATDDGENSNTLIYSLSAGGDNDRFNINASNGEVTFKVSPNFEAPTDANTDNIYNITVHANDGTLDTPRAVAITVTDVNAAPVFTSGTAASEAENTPVANVVYDANASDDGENTALTFSLSAGGDNDLFNINSSTGEVTFKASPNFEAPADAGGNNVYDITVHANDGGFDVTRGVAITVTDANDNAPVFTSSATPSVAENTTAVVALTTTDADTVGTNPANFSITGGADSALFTITGGNQLEFVAARDFETQAHSYAVQVTANDGTNNTVQNLTVTLTDVNDNAPVFTSSATPNVAENTTAVVALTTTDADTVGTNPAIFSITGGADSGLFTITGGNQLEFIAARDFETQAHSYAVEVTANDGTNNTVQSLTVTLTDTNDNAPTFTSSATPTVFENSTAVVDLTTTDPDTVGTNPANLSITGGADSGLFTITGGNHLAFASAPDFENPADTGTDNVYDVQVTANDGTNNTIQNIAVTVADNNDAPTLGATPTNPIYSPGVDLFNSVTASTIESGQSIDQLVFTVSNVNDTDETMSIDGSTVALTNGTLVTPTTGNGMDVSVSVGGTTATVTIGKSGGVAASVIAGIVDNMTYTDASAAGVTSRAVTITSLHDTGGNANGGNPTGTPNITSTILFNQAPVIDAPANADTYATSIAENSTAVTTVHATDPDNQPVTPVQYSIVAGFEDAAKFSIDATSGALTFTSAPDFENPTDVGDTAGNNTYVVKVRAFDGASSDDQTITVTVTNVNEAPIANPDTASVQEAGGVNNGTAGVDITSGFNAVSGLGTGSIADTDPENDTLTVVGAAAGTQAGPLNTNVNTNLSTANNYGTFKIQSGGGFTYTVNQTNTDVQGLRQFNDTLTDTFSYTISDGNGHTATTTVTLTIHGQNDNPVANADSPTGVTEAGGTNNGTAGTDLTGFTSNAITGSGTGNVADTDVDKVINGETLTVVGVLDGNHLGDPNSVTGNVNGPALSANSPNDYGSITMHSDGGYNFAVNQSNATVQALDTGQHVDAVFTYKLQDTAGATSVALLTVAVNGANDAPDITSDGGAATASVNANENQTAVTTVTYTDPEVAQTHTFSIAGGSDAAKFSIVGSGVNAGQLSFVTAPNFEAPTDSNTDNDYVVQVKVTDSGTGALFDTQTITVHVQNVNDAPVAVNHTYNGTDSAIANTALVLDDGVAPAPTDPAGPQKTISGSLLTGATDEDGNTLTVVAQNGAATAHGTVTVTTTGEFTYLPNPAFTGSDTFNYTVSDGNGGTDTKLVTINVATPKVWYVNADAATDGDGTSDNPFKTLDHFLNDAAPGHNVDGANDIIFLYNATNHYSYSGAGTLTLENNEKLIGQDVGLLVNGTQLEAATGVNGAIIDGGVVLNSGATSNTISGVTLGNAGVAGALSGSGFGTLNVDNTVVNTTNNGMILSNGAFGAGATFTSFTSGGATDVSLTNVTGSVDLGTGTMAGQFAVSGGTVNTTYAGNLSQANNAAMLDVSGGHSGTLTFNTGTLSATNGTGLQFANADGTYNFNGTTTLNGGNAGIDILAGGDATNGSQGTFTFGSNTSISSPSGTALNIDASNAAVTYGGTITQNNAANAVSVTNEKGTHTVDINGLVTASTSTATGVNITGNSSGTAVQFDGGLNIDTTTGTGFNATGAGTVHVTATAGDESINSTSGGALNLSGMTVDATGLNFDSTNSAGGTNNVNLSSVTGTGNINLGSGALSGASGVAFNVSGGTGNVDYNGSIAKTSDGRVIDVQNHTTGTLGFDGTVSSTSASDGIHLSGNTSATIGFTNTLTLNTSASGTNAFDASGGGTVSATGSSSTVNSGSGTAVNISGTTIGAGGVKFQSVSANGAVNGIVLNGTGAGTFTVTGDGSQTAGLFDRDGSGGTIQSTTHDAVLLTNANAVLKQLNITNAGWDGVQATGSGNVTLSAVDINHPGNANPAADGSTGNASGFGGGNGFYIENGTGTYSFDNNSRVFNWQASQSNGVVLHNTNPDFTSLTVDHALITTSATGAAGVNANLNGTTDGQVSVTNSEFTLIDQNAVQILNNGSGTIRAIVQGNNFHDADATSGDGNNTLFLSNSANGHLNFTVGGAGALGNTFHNLARLTTLAGVIQVDAAGGDGSTPSGGVINGTITNNNIWNDSGFVNGRRAIDVQVEADSHNLGQLAVAITNNTVNNVQGNAIHVSVVSVGGGSVTDANWTITGNSLGAAGTNNGIRVGLDNTDSSSAIEFETNVDDIANSNAVLVNKLQVSNNTGVNSANNATGATLDITNIGSSGPSGSATLNATITNNTFTNQDTSGTGHVLDVLNSSASSHETLNLNITGNNTTLGASTAGEIRLRENAGTFNIQGGIGSVSANNSGDNVVTTGSFGTVVSVPLPTAPSFLMAARGTGPGDIDILTSAMLAPIVAEAIQHWIDAGVTADQVTALQGIHFSIADLDGAALANTFGSMITLDSNGAGWGWFVDPTPAQNEEFGPTHSATELVASSADAGNHIDLLTAVEHELGHALGLEHTNIAGDLMQDKLDIGVRLLPSDLDIAGTQQVTIAVQAAGAEAALPPGAAAAGDASVVAGTFGNDTIDAGNGGNILAGGAGADKFVFGQATPLDTPTPAQVTHVADYHAAEGDTFDFSAITSAFHNSNVNDALVVRAVEDASGTFATLQVDHIDPAGLPAAPNWVNVAQLDGAHAGDTLNVLIDNHSVHLAQIHVDLLV